MNDIKSEAAALFMQLQGLMLRQRMQHMRRGGPFQDSSRGQGRVLSILKMKPEMGQKELGFLLDMSKQSLAELLGKLERNGYIIREPSPEDRRASIIKLAEKGAAAAENLETEAPAGMLQLFDCLSDEELEQLCDYFRRMLMQLKNALGSDDWDRRREWFAMFEQHWQEHGGHRNHHHPFDRGVPGRQFFPGEFSGCDQNDEEGGQ